MRNQLAAIAAHAIGKGGIASMSLEAVKSSSSDVAFRATVNVASEEFQVADDAGKVKTFRDVDDFMKQAGALGMLANRAGITFSGLALVAPKPFTGDIIKKNQNLVAGYAKRKTAARERITVLTQEIALMAADPAVPQSLKDEKAAQKASVQALVSWLDSEVSRIKAIIGGVDADAQAQV
jgi:hypothetical protein